MENVVTELKAPSLNVEMKGSREVFDEDGLNFKDVLENCKKESKEGEKVSLSKKNAVEKILSEESAEIASASETALDLQEALILEKPQELAQEEGEDLEILKLEEAASLLLQLKGQVQRDEALTIEESGFEPIATSLSNLEQLEHLEKQMAREAEAGLEHAATNAFKESQEPSFEPSAEIPLENAALPQSQSALKEKIESAKRLPFQEVEHTLLEKAKLARNALFKSSLPSLPFSLMEAPTSQTALLEERSSLLFNSTDLERLTDSELPGMIEETERNLREESLKLDPSFLGDRSLAEPQEESSIFSDEAEEEGKKILEDLAEIAQKTQVKPPLLKKLAANLQKALLEKEDLFAKELSEARAAEAQALEMQLQPLESAQALKASETPLEKLRENVFKQVEIKLKVFAGQKGEMNIRLTPPFLGQVRVKITLDGQNAQAHFVVENQSVKELLEQSFDSLKDSFKGQGIDLSHCEILTAGSGQESGQKNAHSSGENQKVARDWLGSLHALKEDPAIQEQSVELETQDLINIVV
ncbi:MAG: hypothetical protein K0S07_1509 [Chlamydiales bacterium]|nr:hypothetical protein [Chlamydiales bacterium]